MIIISDGRGTLEIEPYTDDDGDFGIMIKQTAATSTPIHLALNPDEARNLAAALIEFAQDAQLAAARKAQPQQHTT